MNSTKEFSWQRTAKGKSFGTPLRSAARLAAILLFAVPAFAQYGGTMGSSSGTPSYGHGVAIGAGVGAAAAGGATLYFVTHRGSKVTGCIANSEDGLHLTDDKSNRTFALVPGNADLKSGERVELKGKIKKSESGTPMFQVKSVAKDFGECQPQTAANAVIPAAGAAK